MIQAFSRLLVEIHRSSSEDELCDLIAARGETVVGSHMRLRLGDPATPSLLRADGVDPSWAAEVVLEVTDPSRADPGLVKAVSAGIRSRELGRGQPPLGRRGR